jgi:hypothetical protein
MSTFVDQPYLSRAAVLNAVARQWNGDATMLRRERIVEIWRKKWPLWLVLVIFFLLGILLIAVPAALNIERDFGITREIGVAFLTASLLGISVDIFLKRGIARDAFEGAVGYVLPAEIKEAVHSLAGIDWFAEEFSLTATLEIVEDDLIRATVKLRKVMRNITNMTQPIRSFIHVDEWGRSRKSEILECEVRTEARGVLEKLDPGSIKIIGSSIYGSTNEVRVGAGETVELLATAIEYKRFNDDFHYALGYVAKSPEINVAPLSGFEITGGISADVTHEKHPHLIRYRLNGISLPWQRMMVRWYPTATAPDPRPRYD